MKLKHVMLIPQLAGCISALCVDAAQLDDVNQFDIPKGQSDQTLAEFARQAGITVIVPYDKSVEITTNRVVGAYSVLEAALKLMESTNLRLAISETGQLTIKTDNNSQGFEPMMTKNKLSGAIAMALSSLAMAQVSAQEASDTVFEEVIVTGVRGSLERAMDIKRESSGVVDAISAEDMGKFPDTNLAESLQRITGVSINRVNGEGSEVTVRGFGGGFNLVTLNGRQMPAANVTAITGNPVDQNGSGTSRSFDFSNLASEGVSGIQVYKTGRANINAGGIGAAINVNTVKPLDNPGIKASIGAKAMHDTSNTGNGDDITPEYSGLFSYSNDDATWGVSLFGSFQERDSGSRSVSVEDIAIGFLDDDLLDTFGLQNAEIINRPEEGQLVALPSNLGLGTFDDNRERTNGVLTVQFKPVESLTLTADAVYAQNEMQSMSVTDGIWFAREFTRVEFDGNPVVASPLVLEEDVQGGKDFFFQNLNQGTEDTLESYGFNADWQVTDRLNLRFDAATSQAESKPDGPLGLSTLRFNVAGATAGAQTAVFNQSLPFASVFIDDSKRSPVPLRDDEGNVIEGEFVNDVTAQIDNGEANGIFDINDVGTQQVLSSKSAQKTEMSQFHFDGVFDLTDGSKLHFGASLTQQDMKQTRINGRNPLGGWGVDSPGDVVAFSEGLLSQTCTGCDFENNGNDLRGFDGPVAGETDTIPLGSVSFSGNALSLFEALGPVYGIDPSQPLLTELNENNKVQEDVTAYYISLELDGQLGKFPTHTLLGARYERTDIQSTSKVFVPEEIVWDSDNDFTLRLSNDVQALQENAGYTNLLPSLDFSVDLRDDLKVRFSASKTLARPNFGDMTTSTTVGTPPRPTALGGQGTGSRGNADLDPLESDNVDVSVEWYYGDASFLSLGFYDKRVSNFVGVGQTSQELFGLRDVTSGAEGTRSGQAAAELEARGFTVNERNLFTMTAIISNPTQFPTGPDAFNESQEFAEQVFGTNTVVPNADDPLFQFELRQPVNDQSAKINGFEFASQHFFGNSGFGFQANITTVSGDIGFGRDSDPGEDQFALQGLSDSANFVFIYEKYGLSARLAWNWRDEFLNQLNRPNSGTRDPEFVDDFAQWDLNLGYDLTDNLSFTFEAINLTEEEIRHFGRTKNQPFFIQELDRRFLLGARYTF